MLPSDFVQSIEKRQGKIGSGSSTHEYKNCHWRDSEIQAPRARANFKENLFLNFVVNPHTLTGGETVEGSWCRPERENVEGWKKDVATQEKANKTKKKEKKKKKHVAYYL